jgi:hypothetical protein
MSNETDWRTHWDQIDMKSYHSRLVIANPVSDCCGMPPTATIPEDGVAVCSHCGITRGVDEWHDKDGSVN